MDASVSPSPPSERPRSDVSAFVGLAGLAGMFAWIAIARHWPGIVDLAGLPGPRQPLSGPWSAFACMVATGLPMVLWSVLVDKVHRNPSTGIDWSRRRPLVSYAHVSVVKLAGLWATWAVLAAFFWLARWYWDGQYLFAMEIYQLAIGPLVVLSVPYVLWLDRKLDEPRDGAWHFGALLLGQDGWEREAVLRHWRAWAIKAFFSAFMLSILPPGFAAIVNADLPAILGNPVRTGVLLIELLFVVDVQIGTVGYLLTLRPLDAHIRSGNPFIGGWVAALICYPPVVWGFMGGTGIVAYEVDTPGWSHWLGGSEPLLWLWAGVLVALTAFYSWATMAFGIRFSNLTYRGVVTNGPYRFTRHPAYLSKNLFWWCSVMPFLVATGDPATAIRNCFFLACVSAIYFWRARTEEAHLLAEDAKYRVYFDWMAANGAITARLERLRRRVRPRAARGEGLLPAE